MTDTALIEFEVSMVDVSLGATGLLLTLDLYCRMCEPTAFESGRSTPTLLPCAQLYTSFHYKAAML